MKTSHRLGGVVLVIIGVATLWFFSASASSSAQSSIIDNTLLGAASTKHPVEIFSINQPANSIPEAFAHANKPYYPEDVISYFPNPNLGLGTVVTVQRALPIPVFDGKRSAVVRTWAETVGGLLASKNIQLGADDRITPSLSTPLGESTNILITRVARTTVSEFETIPFKTIEQNDDSMWLGESKVTEAGKNGKLKKDYLLIREDGELVSKTLTSTSTVEAMISKIIKLGTKLKIGRTLTGKSTWYECCGTKVAMDAFKKNTKIRVTNTATGKSLITKVDGCICGASGVLIDLHPSLFQQLGGTLGAGVMSNVKVEEVLN